MKKALHIAASPNTEKDDVKIALKKWLTPWSWSKSRGDQDLKIKTADYFNCNNVCLYDSGRSAIMEVLKAFEIGPGDEVLVHAFTCLVVVNPILWVGAKPVYVDVNKKNFNFDIDDLKRKITSKTRAVIIQHSFGIPEDVESIRRIVGDRVIIIEDLAHALGSRVDGRKLGTFGDATILTFGIEKVITSIRGGAAIVFNKEAASRMEGNYNSLPNFPRAFVGVSLFNPIFWYLTLPVYYFGIGKLTLGRIKVFFGHKLGLLGRMIEKGEYYGSKPNWMPAKISPVLAEIGVNQWGKLKEFNDHRESITKIYESILNIKYEGATSMLRFPILTECRKDLLKSAKDKGYVFGDWYKKILYAPIDALPGLGYETGSCRVAEEIKDKIINLPTFIKISEYDANKIAKLVKLFLD